MAAELRSDCELLADKYLWVYPWSTGFTGGQRIRILVLASKKSERSAPRSIYTSRLLQIHIRNKFENTRRLGSEFCCSILWCDDSELDRATGTTWSLALF